jgi:hypothetical protein
MAGTSRLLSTPGPLSDGVYTQDQDDGDIYELVEKR